MNTKEKNRLGWKRWEDQVEQLGWRQFHAWVPSELAVELTKRVHEYKANLKQRTAHAFNKSSQ